MPSTPSCSSRARSCSPRTAADLVALASRMRRHHRRPRRLRKPRACKKQPPVMNLAADEKFVRRSLLRSFPHPKPVRWWTERVPHSKAISVHHLTGLYLTDVLPGDHEPAASAATCWSSALP